MQPSDRQYVVAFDALLRGLITPNLKPIRLYRLSQLLMVVSKLPLQIIHDEGISITFTRSEGKDTLTASFFADASLLRFSLGDGTHELSCYEAEVTSAEMEAAGQAPAYRNDGKFSLWLEAAQKALAANPDCWEIEHDDHWSWEEILEALN